MGNYYGDNRKILAARWLPALGICIYYFEKFEKIPKNLNFFL